MSASVGSSSSLFFYRSHNYAILKHQMKVAVKSEDCEDAARIRDSLKCFEEEVSILRLWRLLKEAIADERFEATGEDFSVEPAETRRPFCALLDVGLIKTTTGNCVFGALKGALDRGMDILHSDKRFAGFDNEKKELNGRNKKWGKWRKKIEEENLEPRQGGGASNISFW